MHLCPHGRVQAIGRNQQRTCHFTLLAVACLDDGGDAIRILPVAHYTLPQLHGVVAQAGFDGVVQHHLQLTPVH